MAFLDENGVEALWECVEEKVKKAAPAIVEDGVTAIEPETYNVFGKVDSLSIELKEPENDDGLVHEYIFEFEPSETFSGLTITPEVRWANTPLFFKNTVCQVSVLRGVAIMIHA